MAETSGVGGRFGANMRRARKHIGISQEALGFRAGLHRTEIGLLERGERVPRVDTLIKVATALGVDANALLDGIEWHAGETFTTPGGFDFPARDDLFERAAALRARQSKKSDVAQLVRKSRDELDERGG